MKKSVKDYIQFWQKYIEIERNTEKSQHIQEIYNFGPKREEKGKAILQLKGKIIKNLDDIALIRFGKKQNFETEIKEQDIVVFIPEFFYKFRQESLNKFAEKLEQMSLGTIDYVGKQFVDVRVNKPFPVWLVKSYVDIHLFVNDVTFKRQQEALVLLSKIPKIDEKLRIDNYIWDRMKGEVRRVVGGQKRDKRSEEIKNIGKLPENLDFFNKGLNKYQINFVKKSLTFRYFLLLHGPFGTGKTTTLVEAILQNYKAGNKILVSADSNTAVDNILVRLVKFDLKEGEIVRVGPYTKLVEKFNLKIPITIYDLMEKHPLNKKLRQLDIQLNKLRKQQDAYKKPIPSLKRGMSKDQIHHYAMLKRPYRGINAKIIVSMSNWLKIQEQINKVISEKEFVKQKIQDDILDNAKIVLVTNSMCFSDFLKGRRFDLAVIDEGTQATEPSTLLPVILAEKFIIAGDHKQLSPTVLSDEAKPLKKSMFERLIEWVENLSENNQPFVGIVNGDNICDKSKIICDNAQQDIKKSFYIMLQIQYRMNEKLMQFPNKMFYFGKLKSAENVKNITLKDLIGEKIGKIIKSGEVLYWMDVNGKQKIDDNKSIYNLEEIKKVVDVVEELLNMGVDKQDIGVISPYSAQVLRLKNILPGIEVNTIDGFQGREKEVIIISWVRNENMGFLIDYRRLNVAITRAKMLLVNIGNMENLKQDRIFKEYGDYIKNVGKYIR